MTIIIIIKTGRDETFSVPGWSGLRGRTRHINSQENTSWSECMEEGGRGDVRDIARA